MSDLTDIADEMDALLPLFVKSDMAGLILPTEHAARFKGMTIEAKSMIDNCMGALNDFSQGLVDAVRAGEGSFLGGPSYASVQEASQVIRRADRAFTRSRGVNTTANQTGLSEIADLTRIADELEEWAEFARLSVDEIDDDAESQNHISVMLTEARELIKGKLGHGSAFAQSLYQVSIGKRGYSQGADIDAIRRFILNIRAAVRQIQRKEAAQSPTPISAEPAAYVSEETITRLRATKTANHDFSRLAEFCRELNVVASGRAHMATAMIVRAILDHVPPALGCNSFAEVASSYAGSKSFKDHMRHLDASSRKVADGYLHTRMRRHETVPTDIEVDFRAAVGELLREVLRIAQPE